MKHVLNLKKTALTILAAGTFNMATIAQSKDEKFVRCAAEDGMMEVKLGEIALTKAESKDVKTHARHMIDDHMKINDELIDLASKKHFLACSLAR